MERRHPQTKRRPIALGELGALLPATLLHLLHERRRSPAWGVWLEGSLMHCDVTGFTAMSERLARPGKEGAEIMAGVLNRFFERMLDVAYRWGGDQVKFGGDAMLLLFQGKGHADRAAACGLEMQAAMREFRKVHGGGEDHSLRMRAGIHSGRFFAASAGQSGGLLHFMLLGRDVNIAAAVEPATAPGQVFVSSDARGHLKPAARTAPRSEGLFRVLAVPAKQPPNTSENARTPVVARRYVSPILADALEASRISGIAGEHRRVTVMFINLLGLSDLLSLGKEAEALAALNAYLQCLLDALDRHGGYLAGSDVAEDGDKLIAAFGAPVSLERQEDSGLACALELQRDAPGLSGLRHRIGINTGFVFAGQIGSPLRREFTVIGDAVNTAARLMTAAKPGEVIASASTVQGCACRFALARMRPLRVKGKSVPVNAFRVQDVSQSQRGDARSTAMFGREDELRSLLRLADRGARGRALWAYVWGEPGIGKSRLVDELASRLRDSGWLILRAFAQADTSRAAYAPWLPLLREVLFAEGQASPERVTATIARLAPAYSDFAPLVLQLLSLPANMASLSGLDAATRRQKLQDTVVALVEGCAAPSPLLVLFEDVHWADPASLELLTALSRTTSATLFLCATSREASQPGALATAVPALSLRIGRLDAAASREVAVAEGLSEEQAEAIVARGAGNPLFLHELARARQANEGLMPDNLQDLLMTRADALPPAERSVLRVASVIGPTFDLETVSALMAGSLPAARVRTSVQALSGRGFAQAIEGEDGYAFGHALMHDVVYESLPFAERRRLHTAVAVHLESSRPSEVPALSDVLLHHAEGANDSGRFVRYASLSGDRAAAVFALEAAMARYNQAIDRLSQMQRASEADRSALLERIGDCEQGLGRHQEAAGQYQLALELAEKAGRRKARLVPGGGDAGARFAVLARKVGYAIERSADYEAALPWLDRALASLPPRKPAVAAEICAARSGALYRMGSYEEAIDWGKRALHSAVAAKSPRAVAYARNMLGNSYVTIGQMTTAIRQFRYAVRVYHEIGDLSGQAKANNNLGMCYHLAGVLDGALYHYQVAIQSDMRVGDVTDAAVARNNVGEVLYLLGRTTEAIEELTQVINTRESLGGLEDLVGLTHVNLSRCFLSLSNYDRAWRHLRKAQRLLRKVRAEGLLVEATQQRSEILLAEGHYDKARAEGIRAIREARRLNAPLLEPAGQRVLGQALAAMDRAREAEEHLRVAVAVARRTGAEYEEARSRLALGRLLAANGRAGAARRYLGRARIIFRRMGADHQVAQAEDWLDRIAA